MPDINALAVQVSFDAGPLVVSPTWTSLVPMDGLNVQEWTVERGRPNEFERTSAGTATIKVADLAGLLDPTNATSPLHPNVLPDRQIRLQLYDPVQGTWHVIFRGFIEELRYDVRAYDYDTLGAVAHGVLLVEIQAVDAFAWFEDHELMPGHAGDTPPTDSQGRVWYDETAGTVSDRIDAILADVGWPSALTSIFSGNVRVGGAIYEPGTSALSALFDAVDAEFPGVGNLFMSKDGILVFHGRQARFRPDVADYEIHRRIVGDPSATAADDTICPISELSFARGKTNLYNSILVTPQYKTGEPDNEPPTEADVAGQLQENTASITTHGKKGLSFTDLLTIEGIATSNTALEETLLFAQYYRDNYATPFPRITSMVFKSKEPTHPLADPLWKMLCRCDISDLLTVLTTHVGGGGFADGYYVEGIRYHCQPANPRVNHVTLEVDVSPQALYTTNPFDADTDP